MRKVISLLGTLLLITSTNAQSPVGKWKLAYVSTESVTGKSTDILKKVYEKEPCLKNVIYTFTADGNIIANANHCPDSTRKTWESSNLAIKWETSGTTDKLESASNEKIKISTKDKDIDPITYNLVIYYRSDIKKRVMTWVLIFGDDPDISNPEEVKWLQYMYVEL